jgi:hypothetical protein
MRTSYKKGHGWPGDHSPGRYSILSIFEACDETRRLRHNRDSVRPLPTFLANSPSPLHVALEPDPRSADDANFSLRTSEGGTDDSVASQLRLSRKVDTKVIVRQKEMARKSRSIPRWCEPACWPLKAMTGGRSTRSCVSLRCETACGTFTPLRA